MSYIIKMALDIKAGFEPPAPMTSPLRSLLRRRHHCQGHEVRNAGEKGYAF